MSGNEARFQALVVELERLPGVTPPSRTATNNRFGTNALKVKGKIFAMLVRGDLVLKLPALRVNALIDSKRGRSFEPRPGRQMKEWVCVSACAKDEWTNLAREALTFVSSS